MEGQDKGEVSLHGLFTFTVQPYAPHTRAHTRTYLALLFSSCSLLSSLSSRFICIRPRSLLYALHVHTVHTVHILLSPLFSSLVFLILSHLHPLEVRLAQSQLLLHLFVRHVCVGVGGVFKVSSVRAGEGNEGVVTGTARGEASCDNAGRGGGIKSA